MSPSHLPTKGKTLLAIIATIEDGKPKVPGTQYDPRFGAGTLAEALLDYRFRASLNRRLRTLNQPQISLGPGIDRRDIPRQGTELPALDERIRGTGVGISPSIVGRQATQKLSNVPVQEKDKEMDLGAIMGGLTQAVDIYGRIKDIQRGTIRPMEQQRFPGPAMQPTYVSDTFGVQPAFLGALPTVIRGAGTMKEQIATAIAGLGLGLAADEIAEIAGICSKVKRRRRRRRLATHSDIKDMAALKAILGTGKAFDTWIATRKM